jgi:hypothetical protein
VPLVVGFGFIVLGLVGVGLAWTELNGGALAWRISLSLVLAGILGVIEGAVGRRTVGAMGSWTKF